MTNPKGTVAERYAYEYARKNGFGLADRIVKKGIHDEGDVALCPGVVLQVKNYPSKYSPVLPPLEWARATEEQRLRRRADYGILLVKPPAVGYTRPGLWHAWVRVVDLGSLLTPTAAWAHVEDMDLDPVRMTYDAILTVLRHAGYGDPV